MRRVLIIFFLLFTVSIPIGLLTGIGSAFKLTEQRRLAVLPSISLAGALDKELYVNLEKYFNDHFALRGPLIKGKSWIDYHLFKSSPSKKVHIGNDGWLFYVETLDDYMKENYKEKHKLRDLAMGLQNIERRLAWNNQIFIFVVAPNKATIYPEYVGLTRQKQSCSKSPYDLLLEAFEEFPIRGFVRLDKLFMEAKKDGLLYHKVGTHWSLRAERIASEAILNHLERINNANRKNREGSRSWTEYMPEIETKTYPRVGALGTMMGLKITEPVEGIKKITYKSETTIEELAPLRYDGNKRKRYRSVSRPLPGEAVLPGALIFRDSFMTGPLRILKGSFENLHALWTYNMMIEEGQDDLYNSEIVIQEMVERNLNHIY